MNNIKLYFLFYKSKFLPSLALAVFTLLQFKIMFLAVLSLIISTFLIWFYQRFIGDKKKKELYFYYNLGFTEIKLYTFIFFINFGLLIVTNILTK